MTATQAVSSMLAALTGAVTASRLGIAGTIIGAAFMSLASTVGAAIYKHYITSSNARLRAAAASLSPRASHRAVAEAVARHHAERDQASPSGNRAAPSPSPASREPGQRYPVREYGGPPVRGPGYVSPDGTQTQIIGALPLSGDAGPVRTPAFQGDQHGRADMGRDAPAARERGPADTVSDAPTVGAVGPRYHGPEGHGPEGYEPPGHGPEGHGATADEAGPAGRDSNTGRVWPWSRRQWAMAAATALGVFVLAMGAVTVFEALAGKPLDAVVWHQHDSGTTVGGLVGDSGGHHRSPSTSPSPSHSPGASHSPSPSNSPSSSPSPTTTSPTPTPSDSPSPTSSTTGASSPATTNPSAPPAQTTSPGARSAGP